jgi:hypothetical protein
VDSCILAEETRDHPFQGSSPHPSSARRASLRRQPTDQPSLTRFERIVDNTCAGVTLKEGPRVGFGIERQGDLLGNSDGGPRVSMEPRRARVFGNVSWMDPSDTATTSEAAATEAAEIVGRAIKGR